MYPIYIRLSHNDWQWLCIFLMVGCMIILTVPGERTVNFGSETPLPESRIAVWMYKILGPNELAQVQLSGVKISISKFKFSLVLSWSRVLLKNFPTTKRLKGIMNYISYHFYSIWSAAAILFRATLKFGLISQFFKFQWKRRGDYDSMTNNMTILVV